jgi:lysophospholipase L1-like esterase
MVVLLFVLVTECVQAQRYKQTFYTSIDSLVDLRYTQRTNLKGEEERLLLDLYMPSHDTLSKRPLVVFIHGGGFRNGNRKIGMAKQICQAFSKRGYVTASISYRLGIASTNTNADYAEALYRAQQDGRTAIRFLKANALRFGIDTNQVFVVGTSAGAMTSLAVGYMDRHEVPVSVNTNRWGSLEGDGYEGYSSRVHGVVNLWGSMINQLWIQEGDAPLYNAAGTADKTVPFDSSYSYHGLGHGPFITYQRCLAMGIPTVWRPFYGAGHTLDSDKKKLDSCIREMGDWLYTRLAIHKPKHDAGVKRWASDIQVFDSLNLKEQHGKKAILFVGSSYVRLWKNIREDIRYKDVIQRGFGGSNLADVAYYVEEIVFPHQPKAIFFYVGNDIVAGSRDKTPLQVLELFKYTVGVIRQRYPTVPITWLEISPSERRWKVWPQIMEANQLIKDYCSSTPGLYFIASSHRFLGSDGKPNASLYLDDKLHYNEEGYRIWGENIRKEVRRIARLQ